MSTNSISTATKSILAGIISRFGLLVLIIESLISDGLKISEKDQNLLELYTANIPTDIEVMINDGEIAMILLRLVEIIGEDNLKDLGTESLYFIISTLNKLGIDKIRDEIIIKTIPLKA